MKAAPAPEGNQKLEGAIKVSIGLHGEDAGKIVDALKSVGASAVRTD